MIEWETKIKSLNLSLVISTIIVITSFLITSFWNTNDEVGTVMAVTGFGGFYKATEFLQYSNNIYGLIVKNFPDLFGYNRYVWIILIEIFLCSLIIFQEILKKEFNNKYCKNLILICGIFFIIKITLFPQFTILSGLLFISGYLLFLKYDSNPWTKSWKYFTGLFLIILSSLIRFEMFLLVLIIFSPYLFIVRKNITKIITFIIALILIISAHLWSKNQYSNQDWSEWNSWQKERVYWIDNGGFSKLLLYPEIYEKYNYSKNDINLLNSWFFADKALINISKLKEIRVELDQENNKSIVLKNIRKSIKFFFSSNIIFYTFLGLFATILFFSKISLLSTFFTLLAFSYIGYMGRPGEERVYFPVIFGIFLFPIIFNEYKLPNFIISFLVFLRKYISFILIFLFFNILSIQLFNLHKKHLDYSINIQREVEDLAKLDDYIVVWGASFPYVEALPLNTKYSHHKFPKMYILGTPTLNPYSLAYYFESSNNGFKINFLSSKGIYIISDLNGLSMLDIYCNSNLHGKFSYNKVEGYKFINIYKVVCAN